MKTSQLNINLTNQAIVIQSYPVCMLGNLNIIIYKK